MVADTFPEISTDTEGKQGPAVKGYWSELENRQAYLNSLASRLGFDPLSLANWKGKTGIIQRSQVRKKKKKLSIVGVVGC